jgi:hypothetical protein
MAVSVAQKAGLRPLARKVAKSAFSVRLARSLVIRAAGEPKVQHADRHGLLIKCSGQGSLVGALGKAQTDSRLRSCY